MSRVVLLVLTLSSSIAAADDVVDPLEVHAPGDEPDGFVTAGLVWDQSQGFASRGPVVEAGNRIGRSALFAHVQGQAGAVSRSDDPGTGTFLELRGGVEGRACGVGGMVCGSAGLDLGYRNASFDHKIYAEDGSYTVLSQGLDAMVAVPRLTLDAGGRVRFRATLELPLEKHVGGDSPMTACSGGKFQCLAIAQPTSDSYGAGYAISITLGIGF